MSFAVRRYDPTDLDMSVLLEVASNLRPEDEHEFAASGAHPLRDAPILWGSSPAPHAALWRGEPVFLFGTLPATPTTHLLWGFGTRLTRRVMPQLTRYGRDVWVPGLFENTSLKRIEVRVPESSKHSIKWLSAFGMRHEATVPLAGATDETFVQLSYTRNEYQRDYPPHVLP